MITVILFLPESARLLALRGAGSDKIAATLGRVTGYRFAGNETFVSAEPPLQAAKPITALFQIGGTIGAVIVEWAMDKTRPALVIAAAYLGGGVCILALSLLGVLSPALVALVFSAGFCMSGGSALG